MTASLLTLASVDAITWNRWFGAASAFNHPVTEMLVGLVVGGVMLSGIVIFVLVRGGRVSPESGHELSLRWKSWCWLSAAILLPILAGAAWTVSAVCLLSLLCYREYARATGLFRERMISLLVIGGIVLVTFASLDHFDRLFFASGPMGVLFIVIGTIQQDRPVGFIQRVALGTLGFLLFGFSLGYLGQIANWPDYRPLLLLVFVATELNDVFAYCFGKLVGGPKWLPQTSPGKTVAGAIGALVLTTLLVYVFGHFLFAGTALAEGGRLATLGLLISALGQLGDLTLSSIKRDLGVKDLSRAIPGHGGLLDRFDSLILVPPVVYHYISLYLGPLAADQPSRVLTG